MKNELNMTKQTDQKNGVQNDEHTVKLDEIELDSVVGGVSGQVSSPSVITISVPQTNDLNDPSQGALDPSELPDFNHRL